MDAQLLNEANADLETKPRNKKKIVLIVAVSVALGLAVLGLGALIFYFMYLRNGDPGIVNIPGPMEDPGGETYPFIPAPGIVKAPLPMLVSLSTRLVAKDEVGIDYSVISRKDLS